MLKRVNSRIRQQRPLLPSRRRQKSPVIVLLLLILTSLCLGWGMELALWSNGKPDLRAQAQVAVKGTVDIVPEGYRLGQQLYLENCGSCHIPLPPEVMPTATWRELLLDLNEHYGKRVDPILRPSLLAMWGYIRQFSRPLKEKEATPYRLTQSRYFKALHPQVEFPETVRPATCVSCHPGAAQYDYRSLTPEW
ncbi:MAG: cytochrome C [Symploca sp. SIO2E9]|nr:cytochrome C [Symploca sp. SIO2E9]